MQPIFSTSQQWMFASFLSILTLFPTNSVAQYSVGDPLPTRDIVLDPANKLPQDIWSDGEIIYVIDELEFAVYIYRLSDGRRLTGDSQFSLGDNHVFTTGIWSDGTTIWTTNTNPPRSNIIAQRAADNSVDQEQTFNTLIEAGNTNPFGLWSDRITMWVIDDDDKQLYAYNLATKMRDASKDIILVEDNDSPRGLWSDRTTMWVSDEESTQLYAYNLATKMRDASKDISLAEANMSPAGIWSDGEIIWVVDALGPGSQNSRIYAYVLDADAVNRPSSANVTINIAPSTTHTHTFSSDDFPFVGVTGATRLHTLTIITQDFSGNSATLRVDENTVINGQEIAAADLSMLVFTADPADTTGSFNYANFTFSVNDGVLNSATHTLTINLIDSNALNAIDVNGDGMADSDDALAIYYVAELGPTLRNSASLQTTLLQSVRGAVEIAELLSNIQTWLADDSADLNGDNTIDSKDALAIYYVAELGSTLRDSASLQTTLLGSLVVDEIAPSQLVDNAQIILNAVNGD